MKDYKKFLIPGIILVIAIIALVTVVILNIANNKRISSINESVIAYDTTTVEETSTTDTIEVDRNNDGEVDQMTYNVDETRDKLISDLLSNELIAEYVGEDNIKYEYADDGSCTISLTGLNEIGYTQDTLPVYRVSPEGTYSSSPDIVDVEFHIKNVVGQVEPAELDKSVVDTIDLDKQVSGGYETLKAELDSYVADTGILYERYDIEQIDGTQFILVGVKASGLVEDIFMCTIGYEDGMGTYLNIQRME